MAQVVGPEGQSRLEVGDRGLLLLGCGKMGSALLNGWLNAGLDPEQIIVLDPRPSDWLQSLKHLGLRLNQQPAEPPSVAVIATKPQVMTSALSNLNSLGSRQTLFVSVAAGTLISTCEELLGPQTPIVRTMPNTPAAVGSGITALVGNACTTASHMDLAIQLMQAVGETVILDNEDMLHAVTAISGSGPAYVFALTEALAEAGRELGLAQEVSAKLASAMVSGSGDLMRHSPNSPAELRNQVTSPNGTTEAGLRELMSLEKGVFPLIQRTAQAAHSRSVELSQRADGT
ncbi:pyrroline-5-carboxylate reductase [Ruegeria sp. 2205SS24-7]|uniref:pyrroline-5-carboxylate reductase n=1 Tax=Ruegeria discodermiae TaxID=3064389 RepID=UPI0027409959|nr:pyrroline-5-carboxylate reductase [Ruegeria sp. 2205SS24-7]MDP5218838.1 pyrroline-5-carboxylate reductase [Ruegeria sp. 2205SS24-7]